MKYPVKVTIFLLVFFILSLTISFVVKRKAPEIPPEPEETVVFNLIADRGIKVLSKNNKDLFIELQIKYKIEDMEKVISSFGSSGFNSEIENNISKVLSKLVQEKHPKTEIISDNSVVSTVNCLSQSCSNSLRQGTVTQE